MPAVHMGYTEPFPVYWSGIFSQTVSDKAISAPRRVNAVCCVEYVQSRSPHLHTRLLALPQALHPRQLHLWTNKQECHVPSPAVKWPCSVLQCFMVLPSITTQRTFCSILLIFSSRPSNCQLCEYLKETSCAHTQSRLCKWDRALHYSGQSRELLREHWREGCIWLLNLGINNLSPGRYMCL